MAADFDDFPLYDPLIEQNSQNMSNIWVASMSTFFQTLIGYLTQYGMLIPRLTTAQRDTIQSPQEGQMIYNTDATPGPPRSAEIQIWQVKAGAGAWRAVTTVP